VYSLYVVIFVGATTRDKALRPILNFFFIYNVHLHKNSCCVFCIVYFFAGSPPEERRFVRFVISSGDMHIYLHKKSRYEFCILYFLQERHLRNGAESDSLFLDTYMHSHKKSRCAFLIWYFLQERHLRKGASSRGGGWGRDPKIFTGRDWGMGSSTI